MNDLFNPDDSKYLDKLNQSLVLYVDEATSNSQLQKFVPVKITIIYISLHENFEIRWMRSISPTLSIASLKQKFFYECSQFQSTPRYRSLAYYEIELWKDKIKLHNENEINRYLKGAKSIKFTLTISNPSDENNHISIDNFNSTFEQQIKITIKDDDYNNIYKQILNQLNNITLIKYLQLGIFHEEVEYSILELLYPNTSDENNLETFLNELSNHNLINNLNRGDEVITFSELSQTYLRRYIEEFCAKDFFSRTNLELIYKYALYCRILSDTPRSNLSRSNLNRALTKLIVKETNASDGKDTPMMRDNKVNVRLYFRSNFIKHCTEAAKDMEFGRFVNSIDELIMHGCNLTLDLLSKIMEYGKELITLDVSRNTNEELKGPIPSTIGNMTNLRHLIMNQTSLMGQLPIEMNSLVNIRTIEMKMTKVEGSLSFFCNSNFANLTRLRLSGTLIHGPIPQEIGLLKDLHMLDLRGLKLGGAIPDSIHLLQNLDTLDLSGTYLEGVIPNLLHELNVKHLFLSGNPKLRGVITENYLRNEIMIDIQGSNIQFDRNSKELNTIVQQTSAYITQMRNNPKRNYQSTDMALKPNKLLKVNASDLFYT